MYTVIQGLQFTEVNAQYTITANYVVFLSLTHSIKLVENKHLSSLHVCSQPPVTVQLNFQWLNYFVLCIIRWQATGLELGP